VTFIPIPGKERDTTQTEHLHKVEVIILIGDREGDEMKIVEGAVRFKRAEREILLEKDLFIFRIREKNPLTEGITSLVDRAVNRLEAKA